MTEDQRNMFNSYNDTKKGILQMMSKNEILKDIIVASELGIAPLSLIHLMANFVMMSLAEVGLVTKERIQQILNDNLESFLSNKDNVDLFVGFIKETGGLEQVIKLLPTKILDKLPAEAFEALSI